jgi:hypothetical protein
MKGINMKDNFKLDHQAIGDCYYDIYCQPKCTTKEDLLKDMAKILNGELTAEDYRKEIKQWVSERSDECYLDQGKVKRYDSNKCEDCEGKGYYTDVISTGLSDPNDPYHEPHIERCDTCQVFSDDVKAKEYHERHA